MVHHMKPSHSSPLTFNCAWAYIIAESARISSIMSCDITLGQCMPPLTRTPECVCGGSLDLLYS